MDPKIITWDGSRLPDELRDLPPGRYAIEAIDELPQLTDAEDAGIRAALDALDAGHGVPLADVVRQLRGTACASTISREGRSSEDRDPGRNGAQDSWLDEGVRHARSAGSRLRRLLTAHAMNPLE